MFGSKRKGSIVEYRLYSGLMRGTLKYRMYVSIHGLSPLESTDASQRMKSNIPDVRTLFEGSGHFSPQIWHIGSRVIAVSLVEETSLVRLPYLG